MDIAVINLAILVVLNIIIFLFICFKRKVNQNNNDRKSYTFYFGSKFFATALFPTILLVIMVADNFFEFVIIYVYLISLLFLSNKLYNDFKNAE